MKTWTIDEMMAEHPCYSQTRVTELWASRPTLTLRDILSLDISAADKMWVVFRPGALTLSQLNRLMGLLKTTSLVSVDARAGSYTDADARARARAYADARAYAAAYADARIGSYTDARAYADTYAAARALQVQDVLTILTGE